jgi:hypothetical protein
MVRAHPAKVALAVIWVNACVRKLRFYRARPGGPDRDVKYPENIRAGLIFPVTFSGTGQFKAIQGSADTVHGPSLNPTKNALNTVIQSID